jgi:predicted RNA-binding Zn-ribbon protein involved in translation (DUF1610 family)
MRRIKDRISDDIFIEVTNTSLSMSEASRKLGITYVSFKRRSKELNCFIPNQSGKGIKKKTVFRYKTEDIFTKNSKSITHVLKNRIIKENLKEYKCSKCGIVDIWNNEKITLELHHIDGDKTNCTIENLCFLCPNCHSQTNNFGSKNKINKIIQKIEDTNNIHNMENIFVKNEYKKIIKEIKEKHYIKCLNCNKDTLNKHFCSYNCKYEYNRRNIPDREILINDFIELKSYVKVSKKYSVSDNAVKKWTIKYNIENIIKNSQITNVPDTHD